MPDRTPTLDTGRRATTIAHHELCSGELTRAPHAEANTRLLSLNAVKGHDFVQKPYKVMPLGQIAALGMVNVH